MLNYNLRLRYRNKLNRSWAYNPDGNRECSYAPKQPQSSARLPYNKQVSDCDRQRRRRDSTARGKHARAPRCRAEVCSDYLSDT